MCIRDRHYAFLCVLLIADIALVLEAAFFGRWGENGGYLVCHHRSAVAGGRYQKHPRTEGFTILHLAPRGAFRRMEHSARPAPVRLHERRLFQDGFQFWGKIGIFPKNTGSLPAAGVHQQGIGVAVRFGTDVYKRQATPAQKKAKSRPRNSLSKKSCRIRRTRKKHKELSRHRRNTNNRIWNLSLIHIFKFTKDLPIFLESQTCKKMSQNEEIKT